jgi:hypothetical protein
VSEGEEWTAENLKAGMEGTKRKEKGLIGREMARREKEGSILLNL